MFTTNIDLWCFSFVTLFNLQGTRPSASAAEHVLSYHVVRLLSSTFFNFFEVFSALVAAFRRSLRQLVYFTRASWVCQALFFASLEVFSLSTLARPPRFRQLAYYTSPFAPCQHFFLKFFNNLQNTPSPLNTGYSFPSSYLQISSRRTQIAWFSALFRVHIVNLSYILLIAHRVSYC